MRGLYFQFRVRLLHGGKAMSWLENFSKAIEYIETHLDKEISYEDMAKITGCSTFYFQRIFSYIVGISLSEYIRRRRMTQAGFDLQRTDMRVLDVAFKYGYSSPTSFNRAFQAVHGITPICAKEMGSTLNTYPAIKFSINVVGGNAMSYRIEKKKAFRIVGVRTSLSEDIEKNQKNVPLFWDRVLQNSQFNNVVELNNNEPNGVLGVSIYENPKEIYYYIATATDQKTPCDMHEYHIPASTWAVFENDGYIKEDVQSVFRRFYTEWLPFSGYDYAGFPDIEVYPIQNGKILQGHSEVWIAVKQKKE